MPDLTADPRRRRAGVSTRCRGERGEVTLMVLIVPVLMFSVLVIVQFALALHAQAVLVAAAQDGARAAQREGGTAGAGELVARAFVSDHASQLVDDVGIQVDTEGDRVHVEVTGEVVSLVPGVHLTVSGAADGPIERFRPAAER